MSKLAFDYSKWDNLDTDDSDAEPPAPAPSQEEDPQQKGWRAHAELARFRCVQAHRARADRGRGGRRSAGPSELPMPPRAPLRPDGRRLAPKTCALRLGSAKLHVE